MFSHIHSGVEFEQFIIRGLAEAGLSVSGTPTSGDYGADLVFNYGNPRFAGQCKFYAHPVGLQAVQEIIGALNYYQADYGIVFTNSTFTQQAYNLASANHILLMDGNALAEFEYYPDRIPLFDDFIRSHSSAALNARADADWVMNDLVVRYGLSKNKILKDFLGCGLPYTKVGREYHFDPSQVKKWEIQQRRIVFGRRGFYELPEYTAFGETLHQRLAAAKAAGDKDAAKRIRQQLIKYGYRTPTGRVILITLACIATVGAVVALALTSSIATSGFL